MERCKGVRRDSYILALQFFLLTSDGNLLAIGWLAPKYRFSEFLNPLPQHTHVSLGCRRFRGRRWVKNFCLRAIFCNSYCFLLTLHLRRFTSYSESI